MRFRKHSPKILFSIVVILLIQLPAAAQLLDTAALDTMKIFFTMEEALASPDRVFRLSLEKQKLKEIPPSVFALKNLNELDLSRNRLTSVPAEIALLQNLQILKLSRNRFSKFPAEVCALKMLLKLAVDNNSMDSIPTEIGRLQRLEVLDAWSNDFSYFPDEIAQMQAIKMMDLRGILMSEREQSSLKKMLPQAKIYMDVPCNCDF